MIDLNKCACTATTISDKRAELGQFKNNSTLQTLKHCATEIVEATEAYLKYDAEKNAETKVKYKEMFAEEIADIVTCALTIAGKENFDIEYALQKVEQKNKMRIGWEE